jgi:hypothetical protein
MKKEEEERNNKKQKNHPKKMNELSPKNVETNENNILVPRNKKFLRNKTSSTVE